VSVVLENARVAIQGLHDCQPDSVDVLERFLSDSRVMGGIPPKSSHHFLEPCVRPEPLLSSLFVCFSSLIVCFSSLFVGLSSLLVGLEPRLAALRISLSSFSVGLLAISSHFDAKVAKLRQDQLDPGIVVLLVLSVGHGHNLPSRASGFNVPFLIRRRLRSPRRA
jgi:hypothetical protein